MVCTSSGTSQALAHVAATALTSDGREWAEVAGSRLCDMSFALQQAGPESAGAAEPTSHAARTLNHCTVAIHRRDEPQGVRHQGSQNGSALH